MVYGGEIAYSTGDLNPIQQTENFLDAKARIGYAFKNVLVYGVAGGTWGEFYDNLGRAELSGFNYGAGAQMQFRNGMFVGLEYLIRDVSGTQVGVPNNTFDMINRSVAIRAGYKF